MSFNPLFDEHPESPNERLGVDSPLRSALEAISNRVEESQAANALLAEQVVRLGDQLAALQQRLLASSAIGGGDGDPDQMRSSEQEDSRAPQTGDPGVGARSVPPTLIRQAPTPVRRRFDGTPGSHPDVFRAWRAAVEMVLEMDADPAYGVQYIFHCLEGSAFTWWTLTGSKQLREAGIAITPQSMLDALQARFLTRDSQALLRKDLEAFKLGRKESILEYYHRLLEFRSRCATITDDELLRRFESGLPSSFRDKLDDLAQDYRVRDKSFEWTLEEMKEYLLDWEMRGALPKWPAHINVVDTQSRGPQDKGTTQKKKGRPWLSHEEYKRRAENNLCFKCGQKREGKRCPRCAKDGSKSTTVEPAGTTTDNGPQSPNAKEASVSAQH